MRPRFTVLVLAIACVQGLYAESPSLPDAIAKNKYALRVEDGRLTGGGAPVLQKAIAESQFVLIGEDHGIAQIPPFLAAVCATAAKSGFHTLAVETGPLIAHELETWATAPDRNQRESAFLKNNPVSIPFFNWQQETDALASCAKSMDGHMQIWGLDQEFIGSPRMILQRIYMLHPGKEAQTQALRMLDDEKKAYDEALKTGSPNGLYMFKVKNDLLEQLRELVKKGGNSEAQQLADALIATHSIYMKNGDGHYYDSNRERARLMKATFMGDYRRALTREQQPKIIFKFGGYHVYRGLNPMQSGEIGNMISELAESNGTKSLHIMIFGMKGSQAHFAGLNKPSEPAKLDLPSDKELYFVRPFLSGVSGDDLAMFDLRALRSDYSKFNITDKEFERLVFGYDMLIVIPQVSPSVDVQ